MLQPVRQQAPPALLDTAATALKLVKDPIQGSETCRPFHWAGQGRMRGRAPREKRDTGEVLNGAAVQWQRKIISSLAGYGACDTTELVFPRPVPGS